MDLDNTMPLEVTPTVFNLSTTKLSDTEVQVLKKGMKFVPSSKTLDKLELKADILTLLYKVKWHLYHANSRVGKSPNVDNDLIKLKTHSNFPPKPKDPKEQLMCSQIEKIQPRQQHKASHNMGETEYHALQVSYSKVRSPSYQRS